MVTLCTGSAFGLSIATNVWPASWYAVVFISFSLSLIDFLIGPIETLSMASLKSDWSTKDFFLRVAIKVASLTTFSRSAPTIPLVSFAMRNKSTLESIFLFLVWTFKINSLPFKSGLGTWVCRSNLPGRINASSRTSGRLVAAITIIPELASKPSNSSRRAFKVWPPSSWLP